MFELSVASKYLIPRRRQLSVSIISLISILVISLVVWLIVVFFSVTEGLEKSWVQKLTTLTAPVRITPTPAYYNSYYYQIDSISEASDYSQKTIQEKKASELTDPYNPEYDPEIPDFWPEPDLNSKGQLKDLVGLVYAAVDQVKGVPGLKARDFELTASHIHLDLHRTMAVVHPQHFHGTTAQTVLSYPSYLGNFVGDNPNLKQTLLPINAADLDNYLSLIDWSPNSSGDFQANRKPLPAKILQKRLQDFFTAVTVTQLKPKSFGWTIPGHLLPSEAHWEACAILKDQTIIRLIIPLKQHQLDKILSHFENQNLNLVKGKVDLQDGQGIWTDENHISIPLRPNTPFTIIDQTGFSAQLVDQSLSTAQRLDSVTFEIEVPIQNRIIKGSVPYRGLEIANFKITPEHPTSWVYQSNANYILPSDSHIGEGVLLPKSFREAGVLMGDRGTLSYLAPTASLLQEQYIPIYAAGFYDPGIIPIGGKFVLANPSVVGLIRASHQQDDRTASSNGINVQFERLEQAEDVKQQLINLFKQQGINRYWDVQTYRDYEFTREIMQELQSQKHLFMLIAIVIILVACSNIISMLIILVNDKKHEIGILRAMGASSKSISLIFGLAGAAIGIFGSLLGIGLAVFTLSHLDGLVGLLSILQGHEMFSANVYGNTLPSELSYEALLFVLATTMLTSVLAGIVPAVKACLVKPSAILRSSGG